MRDNKELNGANLYLDEFTAYLMSIDKSDSTIKTYIEHIQAFAKWFEETNGIDFNPATVTEIDIRDMRSYLQGTRHLKETTINLRLASLRLIVVSFKCLVPCKYERISLISISVITAGSKSIQLVSSNHFANACMCSIYVLIVESDLSMLIR